MAKRSITEWKHGARRAATAAAMVAGGSALATLGVAYYVAYTLTAPKRPGPMDAYVMTPFETGAEYEEVAFTATRGGHTLHGWWFPRPETNQVIVGCHGFRGGKSELIGISTALWRAGFNVLIFDFHGHGADIGSPVTLGYQELHDFYSALDYVGQRVPEARIGVIGFSMGASVAIIGAARRSEVCCIVADSPFATHTDVVAHNVARVLHVSGHAVARAADIFLARRAGYRGGDVAPVREVAAIAPRPVLLIHGAEDATVPVEHAHRVYEAAHEPKELWIADGAPHCGAYFADRPAYCQRVAEFFTSHLASQAHADIPTASPGNATNMLPSSESERAG
ncbi:MAG: hypothetical protein OJF49_004265 [Ktedonobacterales bacterium]|nr:MAG: hypothetical protein OJF49_004265 [Ktedonobacterales bacterium]